MGKRNKKLLVKWPMLKKPSLKILPVEEEEVVVGEEVVDVAWVATMAVAMVVVAAVTVDHEAIMGTMMVITDMVVVAVEVVVAEEAAVVDIIMDLLKVVDEDINRIRILPVIIVIVTVIFLCFIMIFKNNIYCKKICFY